MKITTNYTLTRTTAARPARKSESTGFADALGDAQGASATTSAESITPVAPVQAVDDALSSRKKAVRHGHALLDELDAIRMGLLMGGIPQHRLHALQDMVQQQRGHTDDAKLNHILDDIDLRVRVELAKLGQ